MVDKTAVEDKAGRAIHPLPDWVFGEPVLAQDGNGVADWVSKQASPLFQKGTGYLIRMNTGTQSGDDWAAGYIPVNRLPIYQFNEAMWSWYQTNAEAYGMNMVIWLQDPTDFDKRVEVTQAPSGSTLETGAGWNAHELDKTVTQFFYYGEVTGSNLTAGTQYTWEQFQSDLVFKSWDIYRISLEWGWYSTGTFENAYLADLSLERQNIVIQPSTRELLLLDNAVPFEVRVSKAIDASIGAYAANDVVNDDDCSVTATYWTLTNMAKEKGGEGIIDFASIFSETENISPRLKFILFNAVPTGELTDNSANTNPIKGDRSKWVGTISWSALDAVSANVASVALASPSTVGGLSIKYKCAAGSTTLYAVLVTLDIFTQTATDDIEINLSGFHL